MTDARVAAEPERAPLQRRAVGQRVPRVEDPRLLRGHGLYTGDLLPTDTLHMCVVRSPIPHGRLQSVDKAAALELDGVVAVLTEADIAELGVGEMPVGWSHPGQRNVTNPLLAREKVYYAGQPIAVVLAEDAYVAEDAAELVGLDLEQLPAVTETLAALEPDAPLLYEDWGENVLVEASVGDGDPATRIAAAEVTIEQRFRFHRHAGIPMETRAAVAVHDRETDQVTAWLTAQVPHHARTVLCEVCHWPDSRLRVIAPHVGGGFGVKEFPYAEDALVCLLARHLGRPVRWIEDRREHFLSAVHARESIWDVELGADADGRIVGVQGRVVYDIGGHSSNQGIGPARVAADMFCGPYDVPDYRMRVVGAMTNKVPIGAYRGFGAPQATFVRERLIDELARATGVDRAEVRRRNFIAPEDYPYQAPTGHLFDSAEHVRALDRTLELIGYDDLAERRSDAAARGRRLGIGIASMVMVAGLAPSRIAGQLGMAYGGWEAMNVRMDPTGKLTVYSGSASQGQGHETMMAQVAAERLGLDPEADVRVVLGDTANTPYAPASAIASRVGSVAAAALLMAGDVLAEKLRAVAAHMLEASADDIELSDGRAFVRGSKRAGLTLADVAHAAHLGHDLPDGTVPGLEASATLDPENSSYPFSTHAALIEVDPATGELRILRYVVVHDCGTIVNPTIVEGQLAGGIAQGIGGALLESLAYDESGQLVTTSFMDYLLPTADDVPRIEIEHTETPSPFIPGGMKGMGEAGTIAPAAVLANALTDALDLPAPGVVELPLDPGRVWALAQTADAAPESKPKTRRRTRRRK